LTLSGTAIEYFRVDQPVSPACARSLVAAFRRHRVAIAHSHDFTMAVYGAWASRCAGLPHVITMHGGRYYAARLRNRLALRAAIAMSARTVAVSQSLADRMRRDLWMPFSQIATIANGVGWVRPERTTLREELRLGTDDRLLVSAGRLVPVKGHEHIIDAMALLSSRRPTLHLAIAGSGELAEALGKRARDHGLAERVHLLGLRSGIAAILAAADVFVLPSLSEGLPLALLEAMFAGRPIVASDVGDVGIALGHGAAGVLVEPGNPAALAGALDHLLSDANRARELGEAAVRRAVAQYEVSQMVGRYLAVYEDVCGRRLSPHPPVHAVRAVNAQPTL
jgi:glycosyltransferase involved in cell wall biosynthesis